MVLSVTLYFVGILLVVRLEGSLYVGVFVQGHFLDVSLISLTLTLPKLLVPLVIIRVNHAHVVLSELGHGSRCGEASLCFDQIGEHVSRVKQLEQ